MDEWHEVTSLLATSTPLFSFQIRNLVHLLERHEVYLSVDGGRLCFKCLRGTLPSEVKAGLHRSRDDIISLLLAEYSSHQLKLDRCSDGEVESATLQPSIGQEMWWKAWENQSWHPTIQFTATVPIADIDIVQKLIRLLLDRHPTLCSRFEVKNGNLTLRINRASEFQIVDLGEPRTQDEGDEMAADSITQLFGHPLMHYSPWLIEVGAVGVGTGYKLNFRVSHIIFDVASVALFKNELYDLVDATLQHEQSRIERISLYRSPYFAIAQAERAWAKGEACRHLEEFWRRTIYRLPPVQTPSGYKIEEWRGGRQISYWFVLGGQLCADIAKIAGSLKVSKFVLLAACYARAVARWSGMGDFAIRIVRNKRNSPLTAKMIGFWTITDMIAVRTATRDVGDIAKDIGWSLVVAMRACMPDQPGAWMEIQDRIALEMNYIPASIGSLGEADGLSLDLDEITSGEYAKPEVELRPDLDMKLPPISLQIIDVGKSMQVKIAFSGGMTSAAEEWQLLDLLMQEIRNSN